MDRYQKIEKNGHCGEGTYGVVYKAKDRQTDKFVALKVCEEEVCSVNEWFILFDCVAEWCLSSKLRGLPTTVAPGSGRRMRRLLNSVWLTVALTLSFFVLIVSFYV